MLISGLLITLSANAHSHRSVIETLRLRPEIEVGQLFQQWLPVVVETADDAATRELHDWIQAQRGVEYVDVVSVDFDDEEILPQEELCP